MTKKQRQDELTGSMPWTPLTDGQVAVLDALVRVRCSCSKYMSDGTFYTTHDELTEKSGKSLITVRRALDKLESLDIIERVSRGTRVKGAGGMATIYRLDMEKAKEATDEWMNANDKNDTEMRTRKEKQRNVDKTMERLDMLTEAVGTLAEQVNRMAALVENMVLMQGAHEGAHQGAHEKTMSTLKTTEQGESQEVSKGAHQGGHDEQMSTHLHLHQYLHNKSISPVDTSPVLKEIERKKNKKNPDGDAPLASRDDDHGHFLFEMTADAVKGPSGGQPRSATESTTLNAQAREKDNPPAPRGTTVFGNDAFKGSLSAPEPQNELSLTRAPETTPDATHEPQVASCEETNASRDDAWYEEAVREAEATGNREMLRRLYAQRRNESFIATFGLPAAAPRPYPDTEPLGNVIYEHASTREARIERKATTRYA